MDKTILSRKEMRLKEYNYSSAGYYFVTICTHERRNLLAKSDVGVGIPDDPQHKMKLLKTGRCVEESISYINDNNQLLQIENYVIMPNHIHMIVAVKDKIDMCGDEEEGSSRMPTPTNAIHGTNANAAIPKMISSLKRFTSKKAGYAFWQRNYYEHIIRNEAEYNKVIDYILLNPLKWEFDKYFSSDTKEEIK